MRADPVSVYHRLRTHHITHAQACGIMGNMDQESSWRTDVLGYDKTGSYGLCQWLGPRKHALFEFAKAHGVPPSDPMVQVDFLAWELDHTEKHAGNMLRQCVTPAAAAMSFCRYYERPAKSAAHVQHRIASANRYAREIES